jgi:predicted ATP-grasp superfamily ATP-dependent carboligase
MSFASRYSRGHFVYPTPFRDPDGFVSCLLEQIAARKADVVIPVFEETFLIAKRKDEFAPRVGLAVPTYEQILQAHNKDQWQTFAGTLGIPVPASYEATDIRAGRVLVSQIRYPVLVKPKQGGGAWGIEHVDSQRQLEALLEHPTWSDKPWDRFFVQEKIDGTTHCVAMLFGNGALKALVGYRQLRDYPSTGGQATMRISVRHEAAETHFRRLLEAWRWHGPCQADFIIDRISGVPYLIDINPRLWGSLTQAVASGVDFPYLLYRLAKEGDVPAQLSFEADVVTRWLGGDLAALPSRLRRAQSKASMLREFVSPQRSARMFDDFSFSDPLPFVAWSADALYRAVKFRSVAAVSHDSLDGIWE